MRLQRFLLIMIFSAVVAAGCSHDPVPDQDDQEPEEEKTYGHPEHAYPTSMDVLYTNPVIRKSLPDPTVILAKDGNYYLFATEDTHNVPIYSSPDLVNWTFEGTAFTDSTRPDYPVGTIWAPDINYINGQYVLYYGKSASGDSWGRGIGVSTSNSVKGPYTDLGPIIESQVIGVQNSVDECYWEEENGSKWMFWGSFYGIHAIELSDDGLSLKEGAEDVLIAGSLIEGTMIYKRDGYYYLIGSAGYSGSSTGGETATYHLVVARSENLLGPYVDKDGNTAILNNFSALLDGNSYVKGPGHCSEVIDVGDETWLMYHGYLIEGTSLVGRIPFLSQLYWDSEGWPYFVTGAPSVTWVKPPVGGGTYTYKALDYIEFTGAFSSNQYLFDTGYVPGPDTRIEIKCQTYSTNAVGASYPSSIHTLFTTGDLDGYGYALYVSRTGKGWTYSAYGSVKESIATHDYDTDYTISATRTSVTVNGETHEVQGDTDSGTQDRLLLFSGTSDYPYMGRVYYLKIYEGDTLVRDYEPQIRTEDGIFGFHDTVTGLFIIPYDGTGFSYGEILG